MTFLVLKPLSLILVVYLISYESAGWVPFYGWGYPILYYPLIRKNLDLSSENIFLWVSGSHLHYMAGTIALDSLTDNEISELFNRSFLLLLHFKTELYIRLLSLEEVKMLRKM
ncbi:hypothetical protein AFLA_010779 [Aspergillus flavus NRRL3357]|nr:hypothetical protein AFLA_010779 [Aspergillus flavus NRRL3357]